MKNQIRIYGCGGTGINIARKYHGSEQQDGCADILPAFLDTSMSNMGDLSIDDPEVFIIEQANGSGKVRAENAEEISKNIKKILVQIPPADFNIVMFSSGGGSGSVYAPEILAELQKNGHPCIAIAVGTQHNCAKSAENTLKSLKSLHQVAKITKLPVVVSWHEYNQSTTKRSDVDKAIYSVVACLSLLTSGQNLELDYQDLVNWLQYSKVAGRRAEVASMHIATTPEQMAKIGNPFSIASLYNNPDDLHIDVSTDYHAVGYCNLSNIDVDQVHFAIGTSDLDKVSREIVEGVDEDIKERESHVERTSLLESNDDDTTSGSALVL